MRIRALSEISRQRLAAAAYLGVVTAFLVGSVGLIDDLKGRSDRVAQASLRFDQLSRRSPRLPPRTPDETGQSLFLSGRTMTIAAATLEQRIKDTVEKSGGALTSSQVEPDGPNAKDGFVRFTASIEVDQPGIQSILYEIEAGTPYLFIDKLSIQSPEDFGEPEGNHFRMTLAVVGLWRSFE
jgi:general secretion pathway protein M